MHPVEKPAISGAHPWGSFPVLPIAEKFVSVNGEGPRAGRLAVFVRLGGCNLRCSYCDTAWAQEELSRACTWEDIPDVVRYVEEQGLSCMTLTGGEPLWQPQAPVLIDRLMLSAEEGRLPEDFALEIETNGSIIVEPIDAWRQQRADEPGKIYFTMDAKCPSSGEGDSFAEENLSCLHAGDALKLVVGTEMDLEYAAIMIAKLEQVCGDDRPEVFLSPVFGQMEPARIVEFIQERGLKHARVQLQLHKIIWPGVEKGV